MQRSQVINPWHQTRENNQLQRQQPSLDYPT